jgi:hypothetical protein
MALSEHPDNETLGRFALGRLDRRSMARVEGHLRDCSECGQVAMQVLDDGLVTLLRNPAAGPTSDPSARGVPCSPSS